MTVPFIQEIIQSGLQIDADRYRKMRDPLCAPWPTGRKLDDLVDSDDDAFYARLRELDKTRKDADRYRALRQKMKNHEVSLELWGERFNNQPQVSGPDELDEYLDQRIAEVMK